jgi:hypothetical protein
MLFGTSAPRPAAPSGPPSGEPVAEPTPAAPSWATGAPSSSYGAVGHDAAGYSADPAPAGPREPSGHARLEQILAESGVEAPSGARSRRRRYRDEDGGTTGDDVLSRVLGR